MKGVGRLLEPFIARQMGAQIKRQFGDLPSIIERDIPVKLVDEQKIAEENSWY